MNRWLSFMRPSGRETIAAPEPAGWELEDLSPVLRHFPIGGKLYYRPGRHLDFRFESIALGYSVNRNLVFSRHDLMLYSGRSAQGLVLKQDEQDVFVENVVEFGILLPFQTRTEMDFAKSGDESAASVAVQNVVDDFAPGQRLDLEAGGSQGYGLRLPGVVRGVSVLTRGYYAHHRVVAVTPLSPPVYEDKRKYSRIATRIPAGLSFFPDAEPYDCTLADFSEKHVKVELEEGAPCLDLLGKGRRVFVRIPLEQRGTSVFAQGQVLRTDRGTVVVELTALHKGGRFSRLQLIDQLELKAALLHHPETVRQRGREPRSTAFEKPVFGPRAVAGCA